MSKALYNFIISHKNDWEELLSKDPYNLKITRDNGYVMFKYNQISSDFSNPIVREARGIIFKEDSWKCVRRAFDKFFNYGEPYCDVINWDTATVLEKVDGSLVSAWYDNGSWHYSTNGTIDIFKANTGDIKFPTFGDIFAEALKTNNLNFYTLEECMCRDFCYTFELVSPQTRVVIPYSNADLYFIGMRDMQNEQELSANKENSILAYKLKTPKIYNFMDENGKLNVELIKAAASELPWDEEGYVVVDDNFNRVKIKSISWLNAHYARNNSCVSTERLIDIILSGEQEEFLVYADDYKEELNKIENTIKEILEEMNSAADYANRLEFENRKDYAVFVLTFPKYIQQYLFSNPKINAEHWAREHWTAKKWNDIIQSYKGE